MNANTEDNDHVQATGNIQKTGRADLEFEIQNIQKSLNSSGINFFRQLW